MITEFTMKNTKVWSVGLKWDVRTISLLSVLIILPNFLGMINISTFYGFKIHFFQAAIFLAAIIYGPIAGLTSGLIGSLYSAIIMHNPYLMIGNAILGLFVGVFAKKINIVWTVILAYLIQLPWLILTDLYLVHMPSMVISKLIQALALSNIFWAIIVILTIKPLKKILHAQ